MGGGEKTSTPSSGSSKTVKFNSMFINSLAQFQTVFQINKHPQKVIYFDSSPLRPLPHQTISEYGRNFNHNILENLLLVLQFIFSCLGQVIIASIQVIKIFLPADSKLSGLWELRFVLTFHMFLHYLQINY